MHIKSFAASHPEKLHLSPTIKIYADQNAVFQAKQLELVK